MSIVTSVDISRGTETEQCEELDEASVVVEAAEVVRWLYWRLIVLQLNDNIKIIYTCLKAKKYSQRKKSESSKFFLVFSGRYQLDNWPENTKLNLSLTY